MGLVDVAKVYEVLTDYYHQRTELQHKALKEALGRVPIVDPVKHGRWNHDYDDILISGICSVCGWHSIIMETDVADMPYCPNCGAKMDGGDENADKITK